MEGSAGLSPRGTGRSAAVNVWVDPREYAPGTRNQTMYKQAGAGTPRNPPAISANVPDMVM